MKANEIGTANKPEVTGWTPRAHVVMRWCTNPHRHFVAIALGIIVASCMPAGAGGIDETPRSTCPPSGSEVSFSKVGITALATDLQNCRVRFTATFGGVEDVGSVRVLPEKYVPFVGFGLAAPGAAPTGLNPLTGGKDVLGLIDKFASTQVLNIAKGAAVTVTGMVRVQRYRGTAGAGAEHFIEVESIQNN